MHSSHISLAALAGALATTAALAFTPVAASAQVAAPPSAGFAAARGIVVDSVHGGNPLVGAIVVVPELRRGSRTNEFGEFLIDSIPPGQYSLVVLDPLLDTLGVSVRSNPETFAAGERKIVDLAVPSSESIVQSLCPAGRLTLGPAALVGFVRDVDTHAPAVGAKVSLVWYEVDMSSLRKAPRVREATVGPTGHYQICGVPEALDGKVQVFFKSISSGEVPIVLQQGLLALRSMSIAGTGLAGPVIAANPDGSVIAGPPTDSTVAAAADTSGRAVAAAVDTQPSAPVRRSYAKITGRVVTMSGKPLANARVNLQGTDAATLTRDDGTFSLDSLPAGTQTIEVRRLGYSPTDAAVELSSRQTHRVEISVADYVPTLQTVRVEAARDRGLREVGFTERQRIGNGYFMDSEQIKDRQALQFSDMMRTIPGISVQSGGAGNGNVITSSRGGMGGCVNFYVDGTSWQQMYPGDLDSFVRPDEVTAVEVYGPSTTPVQFQKAGQSGCSTIVIWTVRRIYRETKP